MFHRILAAARPLLKKSGSPLSRSLATGSKPSTEQFRKTATVAAGVVAGTGLWFASKAKSDEAQNFFKKISSVFIVTAAGPCSVKVAKPCPPRKKKCKEPQSNVLSPLKCYSLYLWITLEPEADPCCVARAACQIDEAIDATKCGGDCDDDEIIAGVGFGPNFYNQNFAPNCKNFCYRNRKGKGGEFPAADGDIFVHAKSDSLGALYDFSKNYLRKFPEASVMEFDDVYGFNYRCGRGVSGFKLNSLNPCDEEEMKEISIECETGGSYAWASKSLYDLCAIDQSRSVLEEYMGVEMISDKELKCKAPSSHLARLRDSTEYKAELIPKALDQSMPFGNLADKCGVFSLIFTDDTGNIDCLLDRVIGIDGPTSDILKLVKPIKGSYFYFPGCEEMCELKERVGR